VTEQSTPQVETAGDSAWADDAADPDIVDVPETASCERCDAVFVSTGTVGTQRASTKLAVHGVRAHGDPPRAKGAGRKTRARVTDVAVSVSEHSRSSKVPSAAEWRAALGDLLSGATHIPAGIVADSDPVIATMPPAVRPAQVKALEDRLALDKADARVVAAPLARYAAGSQWNARVGRKVLDNTDMVSAGAIVVSLVIEWRRYLSQRAQAQEVLARQSNGHTTVWSAPNERSEHVR